MWVDKDMITFAANILLHLLHNILLAPHYLLVLVRSVKKTD